jgi:hypothetical protein
MYDRIREDGPFPVQWSVRAGWHVDLTLSDHTNNEGVNLDGQVSRHEGSGLSRNILTTTTDYNFNEKIFQWLQRFDRRVSGILDQWTE